MQGEYAGLLASLAAFALVAHVLARLKNIKAGGTLLNDALFI
jgi:hypothetical protein